MKIIFASILTVLPIYVNASEVWEFSLMFREHEVNLYEKQRKHHAKTTSSQVQNADILFLGGIAYINDHEWTVWINEKPYRFGEEHENIQIVKIAQDQVTLNYHMEGKMGQIVLPINHSYLRSEKIIRIGDARKQALLEKGGKLDHEIAPLEDSELSQQGDDGETS